MRAKTLTVVYSMEEREPDVLEPAWSETEPLQLRPGHATKIVKPQGPEELRKKKGSR